MAGAEVIELFPLERFISHQRVRAELNQDVVDQIAQSYLTVGQLQPVRARWVDEMLAITDGNHRLAAAQKAGLAALACIVEGKQLGDGEVIHRALIANCHRAEMTPLDTARAIDELMGATGWTASEAASNLGFSNAKVSELRKLLTLPSSIVEQVRTGKISRSGAAELARVADPERQIELARQMANGHLTRDGAAGARKASKRPSTRADQCLSRVTALLGDSRSVTVASAGLTLELFIALIEELLAKARRERSRGTELSTFISLLRDQAGPKQP